MIGVLINQNHDSEFGEAEMGVSHSILESSLKLYVNKYVSDIAFHNIPLVEKYDLADSGIVINVHNMYEPMENHHLIQMSFYKETQESNLGIQNNDNDVSNILYDMLTQSQIHKENDDHEFVEVDSIVSNEDVFNNHEHTVKDMDTWGEEVISKDESVLLVCDVNNNEYELFYQGRSIFKLYVST